LRLVPGWWTFFKALLTNEATGAGIAGTFGGSGVRKAGRAGDGILEPGN
jgi:hypothetical protein